MTALITPKKSLVGKRNRLLIPASDPETPPTRQGCRARECGKIRKTGKGAPNLTITFELSSEQADGRPEASRGFSRAGKGNHPDSTNGIPEASSARRLELIKKRTRQGLGQSEQEELDQLQIAMSREINNRYPLPFEALDMLEEYVDQAERRLR